jgi:hypothetical protein
MVIAFSLNQLDERLCAYAEGRNTGDRAESDRALAMLGLVVQGELTDLGEAYYLNRWVRQDEQAAKQTLAAVLKELVLVNTFCGAAARSQLPTDGAIRLINRISRNSNEASARRWLELMNRGGLVTYNRASSVVRVIYRPNEFSDTTTDAARERKRGHLLDPTTPFGNLLALRELIRSAEGGIRWYEPHMPPKVLEVLYRELDSDHVSAVKLLSGAANLVEACKDDFKRLRTELGRRNVDIQWRVLSKAETFSHHDRFFITTGISRNLPPLNTILAGSTGEILPSDVDASTFDEWWQEGTDLLTAELPATAAKATQATSAAARNS